MMQNASKKSMKKKKQDFDLKKFASLMINDSPVPSKVVHSKSHSNINKTLINVSIVADSGGTLSLINSDLKNYLHYFDSHKSARVLVGNGDIATTLGSGELHLIDHSDPTQKLIIRNVHCMRSSPNIISVMQMVKGGWSISIKAHSKILQASTSTCKISFQLGGDNLYRHSFIIIPPLSQNEEQSTSSESEDLFTPVSDAESEEFLFYLKQTMQGHSFETLHQVHHAAVVLTDDQRRNRLVSIFHRSDKTIDLISKQLGGKIKDNCLTCFDGKAHETSNSRSMNHTSKSYEKKRAIWADVVHVKSSNKHSLAYILFIYDTYSHFSQVYPMSSLKDTHQCIQHYLNNFMVKESHKYVFISDCGSEFRNQQVAHMLSRHQLSQRMSIPYDHRACGSIGGIQRCLMDLARTMLSSSRLEVAWWPYAISYACHQWNHTPLSANKGNATPIMIHNGSGNELDLMQEFGIPCRFYVYHDQRIKSDKFRGRTEWGTYIGRSPHHTGALIVSNEGRIVISKLFTCDYSQPPNGHRYQFLQRIPVSPLLLLGYNSTSNRNQNERSTAEWIFDAPIPAQPTLSSDDDDDETQDGGVNDNRRIPPVSSGGGFNGTVSDFNRAVNGSTEPTINSIDSRGIHDCRGATMGGDTEVINNSDVRGDPRRSQRAVKHNRNRHFVYFMTEIESAFQVEALSQEVFPQIQLLQDSKEYKHLFKLGQPTLVAISHIFARDVKVPATWTEAVQDVLFGPYWIMAMDHTMMVNESDNVFEITPKLPGMNVLGCGWTFRVKPTTTGHIASFKARMVVKGCGQRAILDYAPSDLYSPVGNSSNIKLIISLAACYGLTISNCDVQNAFQKCQLSNNPTTQHRSIHMKQVPGYHLRETNGDLLRSINGNELVAHLHASLNGLKQSSQVWYSELSAYLLTQGLIQSQFDSCIFKRDCDIRSENFIIMSIFVDDIIIAWRSKTVYDNFVKNLNDKWKCTSNAKSNLILGVNIFQLGDGCIMMNQNEMIQTILQRFNMADCKPVASPGTTFVLNKSDYESTSSEEKEKLSNIDIRTIIGSYMYLCLWTRPDIAAAVGNVSKMSTGATWNTYLSCKRIMRYLKGTSGAALKFTPNLTPILQGYVDANHNPSGYEKKSRTGYILSLGNGSPFVHGSKNQSIVALSSYDSETISLVSIIKEIIYYRGLLREIDPSIIDGPTVVYCDNQATIITASNDALSQKTKHMVLYIAFIRFCVRNQIVSLVKVESKKNLSNFLTKSVSSIENDQTMKDIGFCDEKGHVYNRNDKYDSMDNDD